MQRGSRDGIESVNNKQKEGSQIKLKTLREILKTHANKPKVTVRKRSYLRENDADGAISSAFAYISRFAEYCDNQQVVDQIAKDIMAMTKWTDVAVSVIAVSDD
jgi:hypothetical protein